MSDYEDICREDYAHDAWLERVGDDAVGYCKLCGGRVYRHVDKGRRTAAEGQTEPDDVTLRCGTCGEVDKNDVSDEEVSE